MSAVTFQQPETDFDRQPVGEVLAALGTDARLGLSEGEARARLQRHGCNKANRAVISADRSPTTVRVIRTDDEVMIARAVCCLLGFSTKKQM